MHKLLPCLVVLGLAAAAPALAQEELPATVGLTDAQRAAVLDAAAARSTNDLPINGLSRGVHGEMGVTVGSNGMRAAYGTAAVPLGSSGMASFSFMTGQSGRQRW